MRNTLKLAGVVMLVTLAACTKQTSIEPSAQLVLSDYSTEADLLAVDIGKRIASSLEDENFRNFVGEELKKQFDGDDNFLILKTERDAINPGQGGSFLEMLYPKKNAVNRSAGVTNLVKNLEETYPLLQVAFPDLEVGDVNDWLANPKAIKVVVLPANYTEDSGITGAIAYDAEGNETIVPLKSEPNESVIVLTRNERTVRIPKESSIAGRTALFPFPCPIEMLSISPIYETEDAFYYDRYLLEDTCNPAPGDGGPSGPSTPPPLVNCLCDRECNPNRKEMIAKVRFPSTTALQRAEDWPLGKPEMRFVQMRNWDTSVASFMDASFTSGRRRDWKNGKWVTMNRQWNNWNLADNGDTQAYFVFEEDDVPWAWQTYDKTHTLISKINGDNIIVEKTWTSAKGLSSKDLGVMDADFCDDTTPPYIMRSSDFEFELTQK
ncbi:MAG: hypothetical protein L3J29_02080 [Cyclobacteriaceae bacterium]|nr:hypothetical protein [Cyclobacteriaceae bacterium]